MKCGNCKNLRDGWCDILNDSPSPDLETECVCYEVMTNYERIKNMSINEMAYTIMCPYDTDTNICNEVDCIKCTKKWLEMEVEVNER